ncbi:MAG: extracellular solute-binding protein [Planctomycetes bacterium]|nr:extracellular solute-binding protein [Planctomycetota bacterium]
MRRSGLIPLRVVACLAAALAVALFWWTWAATREDSSDGRTSIVFWGSAGLGEDVWSVVHRFEELNPGYRVVMGTAAARNITGDAQRLLTAVVGGVPPDLVWFDRFAVGEWASKGALEDLTPYIERQAAEDPYRIDLSQFFPFALDEASYAKPGSTQTKRLYAMPWSVDIRYLYSNGDLLRQEGFVDERGEPKPPRTWEELRAYNQKLTRFRVDGDPTSGISRLGFASSSGALGNSWLYMYAWQAGGELLSPDRTQVTMDSPPVVRALRFMTDLSDDVGGARQVNAFQSGVQGGPLDPFIRGQLAMKIDGNWSLGNIMDWKPDMDFIVSPAPMPADELAKGRDPITWAGGWAMVMPATAKNKTGAFKLMQYLHSWEVASRLENSLKEQKESEGRLYLPGVKANRAFYERIVQQSIAASDTIPKRLKEAYAVTAEMMPNTLFRPVTPVGQLLWNQHASAFEAAVNHQYAAEAASAGVDEMRYTLSEKSRDVQRQLDSILRPPPSTVVRWTPYLWLYVLLVAAPFVAMWLVYRKARRRFGWRPREVGAALFFASPWLFGFAVFVGGPILCSIVFSFTSYDVLSPARYIGWANYREFVDDDLCRTSLANTAFMLIRIPLVMAVSLLIALLLNRAIRGIGFYRTVFYLPAVMPLVAASLLWMQVFNPTYGLLNTVLEWLFTTAPARGCEWLIGIVTGQPFHLTAPGWLADKDWSKPSLIIMNIWTAGGGMIIWLAGLQAIPKQLYEAASIDGAGPWSRFRHITLPMLSPYVLFNLIVGIIGTMQVFGEAYIMTAGGPADSTLFYAYYLFNEAFQYFRMGYASALAWILFVVVLALTLLQLWASKKWVTYDQA